MNQDFYEDKNQIPSRVLKTKRRKSRKWLYVSLVLFLVLSVGYGAKSFSMKEEQLPTNTQQVGSKAEEVTNKVADEQAVEKESENQLEEYSIEASTIKDGEDYTGKSEEKDTTEAKADLSLSEETVWKPIGTKQSEPHVTTFDRNSLDWHEMTEAIQYATKLPEDKMILWRLENGGGPNLAVGVVSTYSDKEHPYQVRLEWVEQEGWMPTEMTILDKNIYLDE